MSLSCLCTKCWKIKLMSGVILWDGHACFEHVRMCLCVQMRVSPDSGATLMAGECRTTDGWKWIWTAEWPRGSPGRGSSSDDLVLSAVESWSDSTRPEAADTHVEEQIATRTQTDWLSDVEAGGEWGLGGVEPLTTTLCTSIKQLLLSFELACAELAWWVDKTATH